MVGLVSVTTLVFTEDSLTSFKIFTLMSLLGNLKMVATLFIADSLRYIADARTACRRMQRSIEKRTISIRKMDHHGQENHSTSEVCTKSRKYKHQFFRIESFRNRTPTLLSVQKLEQTCRDVKPQVILENVTFVWCHVSELPTLDNVSLSATDGKLVGITGPVGSGKTSLLMTILGELPITSGKISGIGKMAFVSQTPWVYSGTVRDNIVFGKEFHEQKYRKVIEACDLEKDIESFTKRDLTEIGQSGVILSGGQRARVSLARAIYSDADIYLLDDPLTAVDAKVGKHLFHRCIKEFLDGRIRILVTHQSQFLKETDSVVILQNGSVVSHGTYSRIEQYRQAAFSFLPQQKQDFNGNNNHGESSLMFSEKASESLSSSREYHERVDLKDEEEDRMVGTVKWWVYWKYFRAALPPIAIISLIIFFAIVQGK